MSNNKSLGDRMKDHEMRAKTYLPRRTYALMRLDGKAFHTYTANLKKPYDEGFIADMNEVAKYLCEQIQGAKVAFVQSDEIQLVITDFDKIGTEAWFDNTIDKMNTIAASYATGKFIQLRMLRILNSYNRELLPIEEVEHLVENFKLAEFDCRVWSISDPEEVVNAFIWRQRDATRNSILMAGQTEIGKNEVLNKNTNQIQEMLFQEKGINWNDYPIGFKRGRVVKKVENKVVYIDPKDKSKGTRLAKDGEEFFIRKQWTILDPPIFTKDRNFIKDAVPAFEDFRIENE